MALDASVTLRKVKRSGFTRQLNTLKQELNDDELDYDERRRKITISFSLLQKKNEELLALDGKILSLKIEAGHEGLEDECRIADDYQRQFLDAEVSVNEVLAHPANSHDGSSINNGTDIASRRKFKLPKLELRKFDGDVRQWLQFWGQFEKIDKDPDIVPEDKFQYLVQATVKGSRAREVVESFPPTGENYNKAIESLKSRFGRDDLLVEVYVRELLSLVLNNASSVNNATSLCSLYDSLESQIRSLETLGVTSDKCAAMLYPLVESCLPEELLRVWQRSSSFVSTVDGKDRLESIMKFLKLEVESEERINLALAGFGIQDNGSNNAQVKLPCYKPATATELLTTSGIDNKRQGCIFCDGRHEASNCFKAQKLSLPERQRVLKDKGGCFRCFKKGHCVNRCKIAVRCLVCGKNHNVLMCSDVPSNGKKDSKGSSDHKHKDQLKTTSLSSTTNRQVLLQTLIVNIKGPRYCVSVRALIDSGSQRSYIRKEVMEKLGCTPLRNETIKHSLFGGIKTNVKEHLCYKVELQSLHGEYQCNFEALDQAIICDGIPSVEDGPWLTELSESNISLSDVEGRDRPVDLLIGADVAGKLMTGKLKMLDSGLVAIETKLGWTVMGKVPCQSTSNLSVEVTSLLINDVSDLWKLETIGISDSAIQKSKEEREAEIRTNFQTCIDKTDDGRYEVPLLWKEGHLPLPNNRDLAMKRLETTTRKLHEQDLFNSYDDVLSEWKQLDIIEEVAPQESMVNGHYLPHRAVVKENSTTRVRPVFDASARKGTEPSLNQCLESGPNLIELIPSVLLKFREGKFAVTADIEKAFLQISIRQEDRDSVRFFWWDKEDREKVIVFRHQRVVFGLRCSPFILAAVLDYHINETMRNPHYNNAIMLKLKQSMYVDNVVTSVGSESELKQFIREASDAMKLGKFNLRGWQSNHHSFDPNVKVGVLGMFWDTASDTLTLNLEWMDNFVVGQVTKRIILSVAQKIFDPIGIASPVLLIPRLWLQKLWRNGILWDTETDAGTRTEFLTWYQHLSLLKNLKVPRWFFHVRDNSKVSIHTFCDASGLAYGAVVFIRIQNKHEVKVCLLAAKARVAPIKAVTIPRLELIAAVVGARLCKSVRDGLTLKDTDFYFWTDSSTVLTWIQKQDNWTVFVNNRVKEIRSLTLSESWRHVPGYQNPADLVSRGCQADKLLASKWWEGPDWLKESPRDWPSGEALTNEKLILQELEESTEVVSCLVKESVVCDWCHTPKETRNKQCKYHGLSWYYRYFSSYDRIVRMIAWMRRFICNSRNPGSRKRGELSCEEIRLAEKVVIRLTQNESFISENDRRLATLKVIKDEEGILRLKTKLVNRRDKEYFCAPMILPSSHPVVYRLVMGEHRKNSHVGVQTLINILREEFWILKARKTIRNILSKCVVCLRQVGRNLGAATASPPMDRIKDSAVFEVVGVDLAGPLYLKGATKAWICLFTCAVYRAVHLELLSSLSTENFMQGLRRFIARRGRPTIIYSDNGRNFTGTSNELNAVDWNRIMQYSGIRKIEWKFIPPAAPWWGGFWERLVGIMKQILRKVLGRALLSYEEMCTVLCDTESLVNSRPLTYISENDSELLPLSPSLFLQDVKETKMPDCDFIEETSFNKRLKYRCKIQADLRKRFRSEYLGLLIHRTHGKNENKPHQTKLGDIVLIGSDNVKRVDWPLGRVIEILPGKDNVTRLVRLQTAASVLLRPIQRIYPLEVSSEWLEEVRTTENTAESQNRSESEGIPRATRSGRQIKVPEKLDL